MRANSLRAKEIFTLDITKIGSLSVLDEEKGRLLFVINSGAIPGIREKMKDLDDSGDFTCSYVIFSQKEPENIVYFLERREHASEAFDDFSSLIDNWMNE